MPMKTIWKYPILTTGKQILKVPDDGSATPLCVQMQNGVPTIWIEHYPNVELKKDWTVWIFGTGHELPSTTPGVPPPKYLGTVQDGMNLVWHVYIDQYNLQ